jgi:hypothetical protein
VGGTELAEDGFVDPAALGGEVSERPLPDEASAASYAIEVTQALFPDGVVTLQGIERGRLAEFCDDVCSDLSGRPPPDADVWDISLRVVIPEGEVVQRLDLEAATGQVLVNWSRAVGPDL